VRRQTLGARKQAGVQGSPSLGGSTNGAPSAATVVPIRTGFVRRAEPVPTSVFDTYWKFAAARQAIYLKRVHGDAQPWTNDPVLSLYKFTNAYRATDRVSQFLIRRVIYGGSFDIRDTIFRILLFKFFNKVETWLLLEAAVGEITAAQFSFAESEDALEKARIAGRSIYSAAYIMPSGPASVRQPRKHCMHLQLLAQVMNSGSVNRLAEASSMAELYELLRQLPSIGPFLAYQFAIDLNYSDHFAFSEMEFVVPGPGARDGLRKCFSSFGDYSETDVIRWVTDRQVREFSTRDLDFSSLWGRPLQLIDCQNLFCEVDKYARVVHPDVSGHSGRTRIKQKFSMLGDLPRPWFPPKWQINERICDELGPESPPCGLAAKRASSGRTPLRQRVLDFELA
jgi:hypothetical protein